MGRNVAASNERRVMRTTSWARRTRARASERQRESPLGGTVESGRAGGSSNPQLGIWRADIGEDGRVFVGCSTALRGGGGSAAGGWDPTSPAGGPAAARSRRIRPPGGGGAPRPARRAL